MKESYLYSRLKRESDVYDRRFKDYEFRDDEKIVNPNFVPIENLGMNPVIEEALSILGDLKGKTILDIGCGLGLYSIYFALKGAHVTSLDVSKESLRLAERREKDTSKQFNITHGVNFKNIAVHELPKYFKEETFDIIFGYAVLHHLDFDTSLDEIKCVLKKNGIALFIEPVSHSPFLQHLRTSGIIKKIFPLNSDTPDERILENNDIILLKKKFELREIPFRFLMPLEGLIWRSRLLMRFINLALFYIKPGGRWKNNGKAKAIDRLGRFDFQLIRRLSFLKKMCRSSIIILSTS